MALTDKHKSLTIPTLKILTLIGFLIYFLQESNSKKTIWKYLLNTHIPRMQQFHYWVYTQRNTTHVELVDRYKNFHRNTVQIGGIKAGNDPRVYRKGAGWRKYDTFNNKILQNSEITKLFLPMTWINFSNKTLTENTELWRIYVYTFI